MTLVIKTDKKSKPHLAITHKELQGGSANQRNVSLLMKSDVEITEDIASLIEKVAGVKVEVNKASYRAIRGRLEIAVKKFEDRGVEYPWSYVEDFDDEYVVFSTNEGIYYTSYSLNGTEVTLGDQAVSVTTVYSYIADNDSVILNRDLSTIDNKVVGLITKSLDKVNESGKLTGIFKSKQLERGKRMDEIQKAVADATSQLTVDLQKAKEDLEKALEQIESFKKEKQEMKDTVRKDAISKVVADTEKAEQLFKATQSLDDDSFGVVLKSFSDKVEQIENSDLFEKQGERTDIEKQDEVPAHRAILEKKYAKSE